MRSLFHDIFSSKNTLDDTRFFSWAVILVFVLGFVIRLVASWHTYIVNPDGALYIYQAKAIYYGQWDQLSSCALKFISNYPFFVAGAYVILHDWIISAKAVSLIFGSITLIPVYLLLRRFLNQKISMLSVLVFAVSPLFVARSADVIRDPIYWFFSAFGLYFFVSADQKRYPLPLLLASLSFILAAWARVEAILYLVVSCLFLLAVRQTKKLKKIVLFLSPAILILIMLFLSTSVSDISSKDIFRWREIGDKFSEPLIQYKNLREGLEELAWQTPDGNLPHFLPKARNMVWLIALGTLVRYMAGVYFYPFFAVFLVGLAGVRKRMKEDPRILYLALNSVFALVLLYVHLIQTWMIHYRFMALFLLPSFIFLGFGMEGIVRFFQTRFNVKAPVLFFVVAGLIILIPLPKNLKPNEQDKLVFKEIGQLIASIEGNDHEIGVAAASLWTMNHVSSYANLNYEGAVCPLKYGNIRQLAGNGDEKFLSSLEKAGVEYFLWEEKSWAREKLDFLIRQTPKHLIEIGRWSHADTGCLVLFRVIPE
jgi:4-amino-4-deoxy-L-arabinose transferase-like glycosyltransferase